MPLKELIARQFGVKRTMRENPLVVSVGVAAVQVFPNNPNRLAWTLMNLSANTIYVGQDATVSSTNGYLLDPSGGGISMKYDEDFEDTGYEVWAIASAAASAIKAHGVVEL